ncbi:MAG: hypothetical protein LUF77_03105, partial [Oscillospiraceae bacterium]|nr:hypothetical protein [Oscillospiraceae bacterium]MCD7934294.1 hypothetical protein [Oscillospiraceae bacterium]
MEKMRFREIFFRFAGEPIAYRFSFSVFPQGIGFHRCRQGFAPVGATYFPYARKVSKGRALFGKGKRKQAKVQYSCGFA